MPIRTGVSKVRRQRQKSRTFENMMKTLLLQNQQIIIQQQNMMFMVMKQFQQPYSTNGDHPDGEGNDTNGSAQARAHAQNNHVHGHGSLGGSCSDPTPQPVSEISDISETKPDTEADADALTALLEGDGLIGSNLLYNPSTDIGPITPYKTPVHDGSSSTSGSQHHHDHQHYQQHSHHHQDHHHHHQPQHHHQHQQQTTPFYYSSLSTPRVEQQQERQPATLNVNQNVVKNLNNAFKSPTKSNINVQILSAPATREMKNSKAKIIQSMNISEFLRQVHHDEAQKISASQ